MIYTVEKTAAMPKLRYYRTWTRSVDSILLIQELYNYSRFGVESSDRRMEDDGGGAENAPLSAPKTYVRSYRLSVSHKAQKKAWGKW